MPKVGKKHFSYTEKGVAAAKKFAKKAGKVVSNGFNKFQSKKTVRPMMKKSTKGKMGMK